MGPFEIIMIILGALTLILVGVLVFITIKSKGQAVDSAVIKRAVDDSLVSMTKIINDNVERTNKHYIESVETKLSQLKEEMDKLSKSSSQSYVDLIEKLQASLTDMTKAVREENEKGISNLNTKFDEFSKSMSEKYALIDKSVEKSLVDLRRENTEKLDSIQKTVDEKLQKTIDDRLKTSFDNVVTQIGNVNNAIGSLRAVADDVGSLKNILTNVKTKGIVGEVILDSIIGEILSPDQYDKNVSTNKSSPRDMVEFAIKIPSGDSFIYLPVDSKFPLEYYNKLKDAVTTGDKILVEAARKELGRQIKNEAKTIKKYIDVPNTTDFAILFLPTESLYIEAIEMGLFEECQREYHVNIAGPTTLSAIINALRLGFSSLEIQKRSGEVFKLLGAVKTEFNKFADALLSAQSKIDKVSDDLDELVGKRTRAMQRKLKEIGELPDAEAKDVFDGE